MTPRHNIHATGLMLGRTGIVLRGPSGTGKSLLALALLDEWTARGRTARLVADDRLDVTADKGRLTMHAPKTIEGLIELRGRGIVARPSVAKAPVHLLVDLVPDLIRMVEEEELQAELFGVSLPRCPVPKIGVIEALHQLLLIREALRQLSTTERAPRQNSA
jgi:serine kinase of HPr protein (carbohydrate metabolism regulator)